MEARVNSVLDKHSLDELLVHGFVRLNTKHKIHTDNMDIKKLCFLWYYVDSHLMKAGDKCELNENKVTYFGDPIANNANQLIGEQITHPNSCYGSIVMPSVCESDTQYV